ncbi:MAG: MATE family efflux transporter [Oliverpabstia sp.]|nr:MATE family efflux transporter [Oliverpabstia sp.]
MASLLRAFGNSFIPLLCLIFSGVLNVILDLIFVLCFKMGIEGVAVATVISQILSGLICFVYTWKKYTVFHMKIAEMKLDISVLKHILVIGIPAAVQDSIITVSNMVLQGVLNTYGATIVLAYGIVSKYELICMQVGDSLGSALSTFAGQNMGAGKIDRVVQSVKYTAFLNMAGYGIVSPIIFMLAEKCMYIFTNSKDAIVVGGEFLRIYAVFFVALGILILFQNFLRSVGDIRATIWMGVCEVISRTVFALLLPQLWGVNGLKFVSPFTWIVSMLLGMICYYSGEWKKML